LDNGKDSALYDDLIEHFMALSPLGDWEDFPVAAIFAYFDESESKAEDCPAVSVGGFLSTGLLWHQFARAWNKVLEAEGIEVFHATDLETERGRKSTVYENWPADKRKSFQAELQKVIEDHLYRDIGVGITRSVFAEVMTSERIKRHGDIYTIAALMAMLDAINYSINHFGVAPSFTIEKGGTYVGVLESVYNWLCKRPGYAEYLVNTSFAKQPKSKQFPHLQAADYLVFNLSKSVSHLYDFKLNPATATRRYKGREIRPLRQPLSRMYDSFNGLRVSRISAEELDRFICFLERYEVGG
jgi:hypothetical protein